MKRICLIMILINLLGCSHVDERTKILSFQNAWGIAYYFSPRYPGDGCGYRMGFLPLKNLADTNSFNDTSSIFDFKYDPGINFVAEDPILIDQIHSANPPKYIYEKGNTNHKIYWAFMKLKYHLNPKYDKAELGSLSNDSLFSKKGFLPIQFYQLGVKIVVDAAYGKKKYINPWSDTNFRLRMKKFNNIMPCMLKPHFHF